MNIIKWKIGDIPPPIEGKLAAAIGNFDGCAVSKQKLTSFLLINFTKHKYNSFKVNFDKYTLIHHNLIRGPPALS